LELGERNCLPDVFARETREYHQKGDSQRVLMKNKAIIAVASELFSSTIINQKKPRELAIDLLNAIPKARDSKIAQDIMLELSVTLAEIDDSRGSSSS
jgi:hypothetical protein